VGWWRRSGVFFLGTWIPLGLGGGTVGRSWVPWLVNRCGLVRKGILPGQRWTPGHGTGALLVLPGLR